MDVADQKGKRQVIVGGSPVEVSEAEWLVATMEPGTPVEFEAKYAFGSQIKSGIGVFRFASYYDGVNAHVELPGGGDKLVLFPAMGDVCRPLSDLSQLAADGCGSDGI